MKNQSLFERAQRSIPAGVNSPVRAFRAVGGTPPFLERAAGAYLWDAEGRRYIDYVASWGPMVAGHTHPAVVKAVQDAAARALSFGAPTEAEIELAETLRRLVPSLELLRLVSSGTEATMTAIRLARGFTGRSLIVKFEGCYHGHADSLLVKAGSGALTFGNPSSAGVPAETAAHTAVLDFNDVARVGKFFSGNGKSIAAVIVEPVAGNMNLVLPVPGFLEALREECTRHGAVLIFDEVMTGFRVARGGAQEKFGIRPDLTTLGKVIGGGLPVGAVGGRRDIMERIAPLGPVYQAGTLSGNPLAMAAGLASVRLATDPTVRASLEKNAEGLRRVLAPVCAKASFPLQLHTFGNLCWLLPQAGPLPRRPEQVSPEAKRRFNRLHAKLRAHGVLLAPSLYEVGFVSSAHDAGVAAETAQALERALSELRDER